jgi:hypothetical protein
MFLALAGVALMAIFPAGNPPKIDERARIA